jgi:hypothetical protein
LVLVRFYELVSKELGDVAILLRCGAAG